MGNITKRKQIEREVMGVFREENPSIYYSDKSETEFVRHLDNMCYLYHDLLNFPPKMFKDSSLIDFGSGSGENSIGFAQWGARCTLVEMEEKASMHSSNVFKKYANNFNDHKFICSSLFEYESEEKFDFVTSTGVLHHTGEKEGAFSKISSFLKSGGYIILGIGNMSGGFQNGLQRMAVYRFANNLDEMIQVAEKLFKEDIDRSQKFGKRTRRSIIFDRFVLPKQDNPSSSEVMDWFTQHDIHFYSSSPSTILPIMGDTHTNRPKLNLQEYTNINSFAEASWMCKNLGDAEEFSAINDLFNEFSRDQFILTDYMNNISPDTCIDIDSLVDKINQYQLTEKKVDLMQYLTSKHEKFFSEVKEFLSLIKKGASLDIMATYLKSTDILFKGRNGLRIMTYIGIKV